MKIFKFKIADVCHIENQFFGHNSEADRPNSLKFCMVKQNGMAKEVTWHKMQISKIQEPTAVIFNIIYPQKSSAAWYILFLNNMIQLHEPNLVEDSTKVSIIKLQI